MACSHITIIFIIITHERPCWIAELSGIVIDHQERVIGSKRETWSTDGAVIVRCPIGDYWTSQNLTSDDSSIQGVFDPVGLAAIRYLGYYDVVSVESCDMGSLSNI